MSTTSAEPDIRTQPTVFGLPTLPTAGLMAVAVVFGEYAHTTLLLLIVAVAVAVGIRMFAYKNWQRFPLENDGPIQQGVLVKGLSPSFMAEVDRLIAENKCVRITTPKNAQMIFFRRALALYISRRFGLYEVENGPSVHVDGIEPGKRTWLLSMSNRGALQKAIDTLRDRGWELSGEYRQESNLLSTVHTQRMTLG